MCQICVSYEHGLSGNFPCQSKFSLIFFLLGTVYTGTDTRRYVKHIIFLDIYFLESLTMHGQYISFMTTLTRSQNRPYFNFFSFFFIFWATDWKIIVKMLNTYDTWIANHWYTLYDDNVKVEIKRSCILSILGIYNVMKHYFLSDTHKILFFLIRTLSDLFHSL